MCPDLSGQKAHGIGEDLMLEEQHRPWGSVAEDSSNEETQNLCDSPADKCSSLFILPFSSVMHHFSLFVEELKPSVVFLFWFVSNQSQNEQ